MSQTKPTLEEPHVYTPLPSPTSIRLLRRLGVNDDGLIEISLETVDLAAEPRAPPYLRSKDLVEERPSYHCISYTWGNPHADGTEFREAFQAYESEYGASQLVDIRCNGKVLKIRRNLYDYFREVPTHGWIRGIQGRPRKDTHRTLLHDRAESGLPSIVHMYVGNGADVHAKDMNGRTPMHYAAANGQIENVKILIKGGGDINAQDNNGYTPITLASENTHLELTELFKRCMENGPQTATDDIPDFDRYGADDYIWIDAICIDQSNVHEREAQIKIMDGIYSNAAYVLIWLGKPDEYTDTAMSTISKLVNNAQQFANSNIVPYQNMPQEQYENASLPYISQNDWKALAAFFLRQWSRRIWVLQEVVFAQAIVMYYGSRLINWNDIETVVAVLMHRARSLGHEPSVRYVPLDEVATCVEYYFRIMWNLRETRISIKESPNEQLRKTLSVTNLNMMTFPFRATDVRDKILALFPMTTVSSRGKPSFSPDYTSSIERCYTAFTRLLIEEEQSLEPLCKVQDKSIKKITNLPSWVPDFSLNGTNPLSQKNFQADGNLVFQLSLHNTPWNVISLQGAKFDAITRTGNPRPSQGEYKKFELDDSWFDLILEMERQQVSHSTGQTVSDVLWRTLCVNHDANGGFPAHPEYGAMFKSFICAMVCAEPERQAREEENTRENAINLFGLMKSAQLAQSEGTTGTRGPDQEAMASIRQRFPQIERNLSGKFMDCVRPTLSKLEQLSNGATKNSVPSLEEVGNYFKQAIAPLKSQDGLVFLPPQIGPYVFAHKTAYGRRRLFLTKKGYLGLGPASLDIGDHVWIAPGCKTPLILRPREPTNWGSENLTRRLVDPSSVTPSLELVGEAYIHGIMHGEAATQFEGQDLEQISLF